jgi:hypothetical protein
MPIQETCKDLLLEYDTTSAEEPKPKSPSP